MRTTNSGGVSVPFRLDPMSKTQMEWIKAQCPGLKPSGSLILRRALKHYTEHLESILGDTEEMELEVTRIRACYSGDPNPWKHQPPFNEHPGKKLSEFIREHHKGALERFLESSPFEAKARRMGGLK